MTLCHLYEIAREFGWVNNAPNNVVGKLLKYKMTYQSIISIASLVATVVVPAAAGYC